MFALLITVCTGQEVSPEEVEVKNVVGEARLGLSVSKPDEVAITHLPNLPTGIGFIVKGVEKEGAADKAGIRKFDLLWKMNEQLLVNEGQLATLLRLSSPGEVINLSVFRAGKLLELKLTLGSGQAANSAEIRNMLYDSVMRPEDGAVRIVKIEQKKAVFSDKNGTAEIYRSETGDVLRITSPEGEPIFDGTLQGRPEQSAVPAEWKEQVCALRRSLNHALSATEAPAKRLPRPRIVPPPRENP